MFCTIKRKSTLVSYILPLFITIWVLLTMYLAFYKAGNLPLSFKTPDDNPADKLSSKLTGLSETVRKQVEENKELLNKVKSLSHYSSFTEGASDYWRAKIAILVISCNRPLAVKNLLNQLLKLRPSKDQFPIIVSLDCAHKETQLAVESYGAQVYTIQHPDQSDIILPQKQKMFLGYYKLARHYKWALNKTFYDFGYDNVVIVEDDLDLSVDFFEYFLAGNMLLSLDSTLWCVSAWNDHGKAELINAKRPDLLYRTDFFGGLGWLLQKRLWNELHSKWPVTFWDDWMRHPDQRKDRACIRPEISRTSMSSYGKVGVSKGLYFDKHLKFIQLNTEFVNFTRLDLSYLLKDSYDEPFVKMVYNTSVWDLDKLAQAYKEGHPPKTVRFTYTDQNSYKALAKSLKIMEDAKDLLDAILKVLVPSLPQLMSSPLKDKDYSDLKAGHLPAVKVAGGVRITQHKQPNREPDVPPTKEEIEEEARKNPNLNQRVVVSGAIVKGDKDFPPEAVQKFHNKPEPTIQPPHTGPHHSIMQPRKN